jgi:hypothetical protein
MEIETFHGWRGIRRVSPASRGCHAENFLVILEGAAGEAAFDDFASGGQQIRNKELRQLLVEEIIEDFRATVVGGGADFRLLVHFEEPDADRASFHDDLPGCNPSKGQRDGFICFSVNRAHRGGRGIRG